MSKLTVQLVGRGRLQKQRRWHEKLLVVCDRLKSTYGVPSLGNVKDPIWEIFYILLSAQTTDILYRRTFRSLRRTFPTTASLALASVEDIRECVDRGGFGKIRAKHISLIANKIATDFGSSPQKAIRQMDANACYRYLTSLPGVAAKSALCVMMYSMGYDVFPVDVNVHRIAKRLGIIKGGLNHRQAQKRIPLYVPDGICRNLHITMVVHGRTVCIPKNPKCTVCNISEFCRSFARKKQRYIKSAI